MLATRTALPRTVISLARQSRHSKVSSSHSHDPNREQSNTDQAIPVTTTITSHAYPIHSHVYASKQVHCRIRAHSRLGEGTGNNYAYLVTDDKTKSAVIIDPAEPSA